MGKLKERSDTCKFCEKLFNDFDVIYKSGNSCRRCYPRRDRPRKILTEDCKDCGLRFGDINEKGKLVVKQGALCKTCYMKRYSNKIERFCVTCGESILNKTTRDVCKRCFIPITTKLKAEIKLRKEHFGDHTKEDYEELRKLLNRYKHGIYSGIDHYKLIDAFITLVCNEVAQSKYEGMDTEAQIIYMLKDLKDKYDLYKNKMYV